MADNGNDTCARKTLGPWLAAVGVLIAATIVLAFYYADDIRQAQRNRGPMSFGSALRRNSVPSAANADVRTASFVPPWYGKQNPDSVTGATPQVMSFNRAIGIVSPAVVGINTSGAMEQTASGIIVHHLGYILTNYHVVNGAENIVVTFSYDQLIKSYSAELIDSRPDLDLAIIKVNTASKETFTPAPLGDSKKVFIGQQVVAIGNPFGLSQSASAGIISNTDRTLTAGDKLIKGLIQTDASINPGSSGGALVNPQGQVIGINTAIYSPTTSFSGIGFAVPVNQAKAAFGDFIEIVPSPAAGGNIQRAAGNTNAFNVPALANLRMMAGTVASRPCWLGVAVRGVDDVVAREFDLPINYGVLVNRVFLNSPAAAAGLMRGDVIFRVDRKRVRNDKMLWSFLDGRQAGETAELTFFRNNSKKTLVCTLRPEPPNVRSLLPKAPQGNTLALQTVALATAPTETLPSPREQNAAGKDFIEGHWLGLEVIPLTAELATEYRIPKGETGVLVDEVTLESAESGILAGDMVQSIGGIPTPDLRAFFEATQRERVQEGKQAQVQVSRRGTKMTFIMTARNANMLGFAQMEAAQPIQPGALRPHRNRGRACTNCHIFMTTGGQLPTDAGDILPDPPPITKDAKAPHRYRGPCITCHTVVPTNAGGVLAAAPVITKNATAPHRYRGRCATCHTIR